MRGIDISNYQRGNYKYLIDTYGKDFVITRASWRFSVDPMCDVMYQYAKNRGKKLGFYFFPLTSDGDPEIHAEWAYKQVIGYINEAIPILDWEAYNGSEGNNNPGNVNWALRWLRKFEELSGVKPMIYMNSNCNSIYNWQSVVDNNNGLWIANYGKNTGFDNGRPTVKYWNSAAMHQYTSRLGGQSLDGDTFYGDIEAWDKFARSKKVQTGDKPAPLPTDKIYTEDEVKLILEQASNKFQQQIDELERDLREKTSKLTVCETVVNDAKKGLDGIQNYK